MIVLEDENNSFEVVSVLDTNFHKITVQELIRYIIERAHLDQKTIVGNVNIRALNFCSCLPWYRKFINQANLVFCDGFGVMLGARLNGYKLESKHRMTCPDYIESLAQACAQSQTSIFLLAGRPGVTEKAISKLKQVAPNLRVAGHHGFFEKSGKENQLIVDRINEFNPDVLYVGFGMPRQEQWIMENSKDLDAKVFLPLGACLDFYTETVYRGPKWMTDRGFEWLTRLLTEPKRLWSRYIIGNSVFFCRVLIHYLGTVIAQVKNKVYN